MQTPPLNLCLLLKSIWTIESNAPLNYKRQKILSFQVTTYNYKRCPKQGRHTLAGDGLGVGLLAFLTGTAGDQLVEGDWDWTGDGGAGGFLAAGSGDRSMPWPASWSFRNKVYCAQSPGAGTWGHLSPKCKRKADPSPELCNDIFGIWLLLKWNGKTTRKQAGMGIK